MRIGGDMFVHAVNFAENEGAGEDIRQQINALANEVRQHPEDQVPLLKFTHAFAQIWIKTQQPEALPKILACLERLVALEKGLYVRQVHQLIEGVARHAAAQNLADAVAKLKEINGALVEKARNAGASSSEPLTQEVPQQMSPPEPTPAPSVSQEALPEPIGPSAGPEDLDEVEIDLIPDMDSILTDRNSDAQDNGPVPIQAPQEPPQLPSSVDMDLEVETVADDERPVPLGGSAPPGVSIETELPEDEDLFGGDGRSAEQELATLQAGNLREIQDLFKEGKIGEIIQAYAVVSSIRLKRYIIEQLGARIAEWRIEPLLAVGAIEKDDQVLRHVLRILLRHDRKEVLQQIDLDNYSPDLQRVAALLLNEMGMRAALPKLARCLENKDMRVRIAGASGIARLGEAGAPHIARLLEMVRQDRDVSVRHAAARALFGIGTREAYDAFETAAGKAQFDAEIYAELDKLREKFSPKKSAAKTAGKQLTPQQKAKRKQQIILVVILVIFLIVAWKMGWLGGGESLPPPSAE